MGGVNGSQYTTDPSTLTYPLRGITYVELPDMGSWSPIDFGLYSSGILIVHNSQGNALMNNLNSGVFRGLIISDDMLHIHNLILGGVFLLTDHPRDGNCIGNGSGTLLMSKELILQALETAQIGLGSVALLDVYE